MSRYATGGVVSSFTYSCSQSPSQQSCGVSAPFVSGFRDPPTIKHGVDNPPFMSIFSMMFHLPSGKLTVCYGKSPCLMGKLTINCHFQ